MSLKRWCDAKPLDDNSLQRFMDLHGIPWINAVERVKGIEPSS
jgi:hypothetical protein